MKSTHQITLHDEAALALQRATAEAKQFGINPRQFPAALLERAAEAYARAGPERCYHWTFELRLVTPEERAVFDILNRTQMARAL